MYLVNVQQASELKSLCSQIIEQGNIVILLGPGASTASGIPDYAAAASYIGGKYARWCTLTFRCVMDPASTLVSTSACIFAFQRIAS
jgi:hypothetical protein